MNREEQVITGFRNLLNKIIRLNKFELEDSLKGYKPSEVHCIEYIGKNADPNVTKLAEAFYMTNGAISKMTKKLIKKPPSHSAWRGSHKNTVPNHIRNHVPASLRRNYPVQVVRVRELIPVPRSQPKAPLASYYFNVLKYTNLPLICQPVRFFIQIHVDKKYIQVLYYN